MQSTDCYNFVNSYAYGYFTSFEEQKKIILYKLAVNAVHWNTFCWLALR